MGGHRKRLGKKKFSLGTPGAAKRVYEKLPGLQAAHDLVFGTAAGRPWQLFSSGDEREAISEAYEILLGVHPACFTATI